MPYKHVHRYGRTPDTLALLIFLTLAGIFQLITQSVPPSVSDQLPQTFSIFWAIILTLGSSLSLMGVLWRDAVYSWVIELGGRIMLSTACASYAIALGASSSWPGALIASSFVLALTFSSLFRAYQVAKRIGQWKKEVKIRISENE